jgi:endonuclease/exonuclease/phosphatase (EEP) superfamily protein YafD
MNPSLPPAGTAVSRARRSRLDAWLRALLIGVFVTGLLPLGAPYWWRFELLSHFRLQFVVLALIALALAIRHWRRVPFWLAAAVVALNARPLLPYLPGLPTSNAAAAGPVLDVLTVNLYWGNRNLDDILSLLKTPHPPDLVSIDELTPQVDAALEALESEYPYRYTLPARGAFGIGILSRYPLVDPMIRPLFGRPAIDSRVELPWGRARFIAVHLMPPMDRDASARRNRQLDALAAMVAETEEPLIVCGDFNLSPYSPFFTRFTDASALRDTRWRGGFDYSWPSFMPVLGIPLDHCLIRGPLETKSVDRLEPNGSDHYPVRVRLLWQDTE